MKITRPEVSLEGRYWDYTTPFAARGRIEGEPTGIGIDVVAGIQSGTSSYDTTGLSFLSVVYPKSIDDLSILGQLASTRTDIQFSARGGGTGTNGQALNHGVVVDTRRHMHRLLHLNRAEGWADVEPGLVLDDLNDLVRDSGWFFAPETSTSIPVARSRSA